MGLGVWAAGDGDDGVVLDRQDAAELGGIGVAGVENLLVVVLLEGVGVFVAQVLERDVAEGLHGGVYACLAWMYGTGDFRRPDLYSLHGESAPDGDC